MTETRLKVFTVAVGSIKEFSLKGILRSFVCLVWKSWLMCKNSADRFIFSWWAGGSSRTQNVWQSEVSCSGWRQAGSLLHVWM